MTNIERLVREGALDADAAKSLRQELRDKVERLPAADIDTIIKFRLVVSPETPMEPEEDGSFF
jgi:hypothetical protein